MGRCVHIEVLSLRVLVVVNPFAPKTTTQWDDHRRLRMIKEGQLDGTDPTITVRTVHVVTVCVQLVTVVGEPCPYGIGFQCVDMFLGFSVHDDDDEVQDGIPLKGIVELLNL